MTSITKQIKINISEPLDLQEKTIEYFKKSGFEILKSDREDTKLIIQRGSIFSNMWTFNPLKWKSEINIEIIGQEVIAEFNINTAGQIPTQKEEVLWDNFIENYKRYLADKKYDYESENKKALNTTKKNSWKYIGWALLGGLIGGIPSGLIAHWTGIDSIVSLGAAGGAIGLLTKKINDEKMKNAL